MKKSELKIIIKECLLEILSEGLGSKASIREAITKQPQKQLQAPARRPQIPQEFLSELRGMNPVIAEMARDTIANTLPSLEKANTGVDIDSFDTDAWAQLAFVDKKSHGI